MVKDPRVTLLLEFNSRIKPRELFPVMEEGAAKLIEANPFAFALAAVLDRGTEPEILSPEGVDGFFLTNSAVVWKEDVKGKPGNTV